jgi:hypothetical protein
MGNGVSGGTIGRRLGGVSGRSPWGVGWGERERGQWYADHFGFLFSLGVEAAYFDACRRRPDVAILRVCRYTTAYAG